jgi:predicted enzyme related to lactoylglutathione lyase
VTIATGGRRAAPASGASTQAQLHNVPFSELGATTVRPAEDTPYGRIAVISDPAGATFAVIRLAPELT